MSRLVGAEPLDDKASAGWTTYGTLLSVARMSEYIYKERTERNLPHFHPPGATLFVTFRLAGTIPKPTLRQYYAQKQWLEEETKRIIGLKLKVLLPEGLRFISKNPPLDRIMKSLKGYSAWEANGAIGRRGAFWQRESYDHVVRDNAEFDRIVKYVLNNPVKVGLAPTWQEWKWSYWRENVP